MHSEREKMLSGELYDPMDRGLVEDRARARDLCQELNSSRESESDRRGRILSVLFGVGGDSAWMQPPFFCDYGTNIELGARVFFNFNCVVLDVCRVQIGSDVWVGGGAIILPGVRIGSRAVIGAGSVVTRDVPEDVFAAGNPCRVIRKNPE